MVVCLLGAENRKIEVLLLTHMPPCSEDEKVENFVLSKSSREFNSFHFGSFPVDKILNIDDFGPFLVKWSIFVWDHF
jgi:hypothetical protein